jgi:pilus assembly protein CpaF
VISDYDERSVGGNIPQLIDARSAARQIFDAVAGFGPLQKFLDDSTVEEIWINGRLPDRFGEAQRLPAGPTTRA